MAKATVQAFDVEDTLAASTKINESKGESADATKRRLEGKVVRLTFFWLGLREDFREQESSKGGVAPVEAMG